MAFPSFLGPRHRVGTTARCNPDQTDQGTYLTIADQGSRFGSGTSKESRVGVSADTVNVSQRGKEGNERVGREKTGTNVNTSPKQPQIGRRGRADG